MLSHLEPVRARMIKLLQYVVLMGGIIGQSFNFRVQSVSERFSKIWADTFLLLTLQSSTGGPGGSRPRGGALRLAEAHCPKDVSKIITCPDIINIKFS